ncbi:MAG: DUF6644 family protein [Steroidobacteraceae bacterium]
MLGSISLHPLASVHTFAGWLSATSASSSIKSVSWVIPFVQSIHIVTIGVVFVSCLMIALRVLGTMRADEPLEAVWRRFAPWMWSGLLVMAATGFTLVVGEPEREFGATSFWVKMLLVAIGVSSTALYGRSLRTAAVGARAEYPVSVKAASILIVIVWLAVIFLGRAIAYDKQVWGALSSHA